jgi:Mg2+ and Co2+ transporter CorA
MTTETALATPAPPVDVAPLRVFVLEGTQVRELDAIPERLPDAPGAFLWLAATRSGLQAALTPWLLAVQRLTGVALLDLHVSDLLNPQLGSRHDETRDYDLLVFRRLVALDGAAGTAAAADGAEASPARAARRSGPPILRRIDTTPVGFAVFDRVLLRVHPDDGALREAYAARLLGAAVPEAAGDARSLGSRGVPTSPADMALRMTSQIVDGYLGLRRELSRQLEHWQVELLDPRSRFSNWSALLQARAALHEIEELCEDQRHAIDSLSAVLRQAEDGELLRVRASDVLEHIERVARHVTRLEHNVETAVQMHFSVQGHRTNDIMRTLTAITAIFLPLNLITGFFGMNFEFMPLIHHQAAFWWTVALMAGIALVTGLVFWRKRYIARSGGR